MDDKTLNNKKYCLDLIWKMMNIWADIYIISNKKKSTINYESKQYLNFNQLTALCKDVRLLLFVCLFEDDMRPSMFTQLILRPVVLMKVSWWKYIIIEAAFQKQSHQNPLNKMLVLLLFHSREPLILKCLCVLSKTLYKICMIE